MLRDRLIRLGRLLAGIAVVVWLGRSLARNWADIATQPIEWRLDPVGLVGSAVLVWAMYALLVGAWRLMLLGWGQHLSVGTAARIWTVSSLGKYIPGKVWAVAGMALMARDAGVAPWAATASAIILQALAIATGAGLAGVSAATALEGSYPGARVALIGLAVVSCAGLVLLLWPAVAVRLVRLASGEPPASSPSRGPVLVGAGANLLAWAGYGLALWLLARATMPAVSLSVGQAIGAFAASYVAGLLFLLAPAGVGVREGVFVMVLQGPMGWGPAAALAVASRLLLTVTEVGAALPFLFFFRGGKPRVTS